MSNILTTNLRHKNIDNFINTIANESVYFAFSNPDPWANENSPDIPKDSFNLHSDVFSDMLYAKKIISANVTRVIRNVGWVAGTRYQAWSASQDIADLTRTRTYVTATATATIVGGVVTSITVTNPGAEYVSAPTVSFSSGSAAAVATISAGSVLSISVTNGGSGYVTPPTVIISSPSTISTSTFEIKPFYVITDEYKVYKCLGNASGVPVTDKPTSTSTAAGISQTTSDGYQWKYMFTLTTANIERFYTSSWIPVKTLSSDDGTTIDGWAVQTAALAGSSPYHGSDPEKELDATALMVKVRVSGDEGATIVDTNDYRQISLISNPIFYGATGVAPWLVNGATGVGISTQMGLASNHQTTDTTAYWYPTTGKKVIVVDGPGKGQIRSIANFYPAGKVIDVDSAWTVQPTSASHYGIIANSTVANQTVVLNLGVVTNGPFVQDSTVTQTGTSATGKVVKYDSTSTPKKLYLTSISGTFNGSGSITAGSISSTVTGITNPTLATTVGDVLYIENRKAITRYPDQIEDVKVIIQY